MKKHVSVGTIALLLLTLVAYLPARNGGFIWDDKLNISGNRNNGPGGLEKTWTDLQANVQYFPLTYTVFWAAHRLWGDDPFGYHLLNCLLHGTNAVLFWRLLSYLSVPGGFLAAGIFALHPVMVESVAWLSELKNTLSGMFFLAALLLLSRALIPPSEPRRDAGPGVFIYPAALFLQACALLSKTTTLMLPFAMALLIWFKRDRVSLKELARLAPLLVFGAAAGAVTYWVEKYDAGAKGPEFSWTWAERLIIAGKNLWFYAGKLLWPAHLSFIPRAWSIDAGHAPSFLYPAAALAVLAALWQARRRIGRGPFTAAAWFLLLLLPALGFVNFYFMRYSFVQDHFQYLASLGPIALFAALASATGIRLAHRPGISRTVAQTLPFVLLLPCLGALTWRQSGRYVSEEAIWRSTITENPRAWLAHYNLGVILIARGLLDEAARENREALRLKPDYCEARTNLGTLLVDLKSYEEGTSQLREALRSCPPNPEIDYNLGVALMRQGRPSEAEAAFRRALALKPGLTDAHRNLFYLLQRLGRVDEAAVHRAQGWKPGEVPGP